MAPKPAPKLTKKQLQQLAKQEAKKKEQQQLERRRIQQEKLSQQRRLQEIEQQKRKQKQRERIVQEQEQYYPTLDTKIKQQNKAYQQLIERQQWQNLTSQYFINYDTNQSKLSTFISLFREDRSTNQEKILQNCEESQIYIEKLHQKLLKHRSQYEQAQQQSCQQKINELHCIQLQKLEDIMITLANSAQDIEDKNNQFLKTKTETNRKVDGQKLVQYKHFLTKNFKIGMFMNSTTTKNINKFRPIQIKQFGLNTQIPSKWINSNTIVKFQWTNFNPYIPKSYQPFIVIGGVYNLQFYELLLGSKKISNITIKKFFKDKEILDKFKLPTSVIKEPFQVMYQIPQYVFLHTFDRNSIKIAQYDFSNSKWSILPNDTVVDYQQPDKKLVCRILRPQPIAYVQDKCLDFPYVAWQLRTVEEGIVHLDIQLKRCFPESKDRFMVKFQIVQNTVRLIMDKKYPQLKDLYQPITPQSMFNSLSKRGIHLLPTNQDYGQAQLPQKDKVSEKNAIRDIAYAVQSFYVRSQPYNSSYIAVKMKENLQYESVFLQDQQKDWKKIRWGDGNRCWVQNRNIKDRHLNFQILLQNHEFTQRQCLQRMKYDRKYLLRKTIMKVLQLTRVLSFTCKQQQQSSLIESLKKKIIIK